MFVALSSVSRNEQEHVTFPLVYIDGNASDWPSQRKDIGVLGEIFRAGNSVLLPSRTEMDRYEDWFLNSDVTNANSWLGIPMSVRNQVVGIVGVFDFSGDDTFDEEDFNLLQAIANLFAIAIENSRIYEECRHEILAAKQLSTLGTAIAALQHRINNTFNIIIPNVTRLRSRVDMSDPTMVEILDIIERNARYTSTIITRIQEPLKEVEVTDVNIDVILETAVLRKRALWNTDVRPQITIEFEPNMDIPVIRGPSGQIAEVFDNLLENAYKSMPMGGTIQVESKLENGIIHVRVADTGVGIPKEKQERLFKKPVPSKEPGAGAGLGL